MFVREGFKRKQLARADNLYTVWVGTHADKKTVDRLLKETQPKPKTSGKDVGKEWLRLAKDLRGWR